MIDYRDSEMISVDIETYDPFLRDRGPSLYFPEESRGYILGVSFSNGESSTYADLNHIDTTEETRSQNFRYIADQLKAPNSKVFANGLYDLDWLVNGYGLKVNGRLHDVQVMEPLLDEYLGTYSLDSLAFKYLKENKAPEDILRYCQEMGLKTSTKSMGREWLYKMPSTLVRRYAEEDARLTIKVAVLQFPEIQSQGLQEVYDLEMSLFPLLLLMRKTGVRVDKDLLLRTGQALAEELHEEEKKLNKGRSYTINVNSAKDLERLFRENNLKIYYGEPTERMIYNGVFQGNPTFSKGILSKYKDPLVKSIAKIRHIKTLRSLFIEPYQEFLHDGRIHTSFHPLRSDDRGTVSGRFSSSRPNLQQVSSKEEEDVLESSHKLLKGQIIRRLFLPEENQIWLKFDWSQIEYRLISHYASGEGSALIRERYQKNPNTDYHAELMEMTGITDRKLVKTLNFGAAYSMGPDTMSEMYGWDLEEAKSVHKMYHEKVPFIRNTSFLVSCKGKKVGFIRTILNRKARLRYKNKAYVLFNRLIQGSAADLMKKAMKDSYEAGVFNVLSPHLTVHDEMDSSMPDTKEGREAGLELKRIMESCLPLRVPIIADGEVGKNWADLEKWS